MEAAFKVGAASSLRGWPCCSHLHLDGQGADMAWLGFGRMNLTEGGKEKNIFKIYEAFDFSGRMHESSTELQC